MTSDEVIRGEAANPTILSIEDLRARIGGVVGVSSWREVGQDRIDRFAEVTIDHQFIHLDPERAKAETPFGGTIAHGFLTLSLLSSMAYEVLPTVRGRAMGINYGFDRVRFLAPVRAGSRVRGHFTLADVAMRSEKEAMLRHAVTIEIEGQQKPALAADWLTLAVLA
ncbi:MAG TPA: MaoC family dehydratase [Microvirga sp.]|jgi:acyl dehydratase|nr:MaoC family dehydratase [Microvirga sp.]